MSIGPSKSMSESSLAGISTKWKLYLNWRHHKRERQKAIAVQRDLFKLAVRYFVLCVSSVFSVCEYNRTLCFYAQIVVCTRVDVCLCLCLCRCVCSSVYCVCSGLTCFHTYLTFPCVLFTLCWWSIFMVLCG